MDPLHHCPLTRNYMSALRDGLHFSFPLRVNDNTTLYIDCQMIHNSNPNVPILCVEYKILETNIQKHVQVDMVDREGGHQLILEW